MTNADRLIGLVRAAVLREVAERLEVEAEWALRRNDDIKEWHADGDLQEFTYCRVLAIEQQDGKLLLRFDRGWILLSRSGLEIRFPNGDEASYNLGV